MRAISVIKRKISNTRYCQKPYNILFFGSDNFSKLCLEKLISKEHLVKNLDIITPHEFCKPIVQIAKEKQIAFFKAPAIKEDWKDWKLPKNYPYDLAVVVSFGYFLPSFILNQFKWTLNVHPSLLPKYRGSSPIQYAILNNDTETGVSVIELSPKKFDSGKILKQTRIAIPKNINYELLHELLAKQGGEDLVETIENIGTYHHQAFAQDPNLVSMAPKIKVKDSQVLWEKHTCAEIFAKFRAFHPRVLCID
jgi:methionyl-tRNA formyltransferase